MLKDKVQYEPISVGEYEKRYEAQQLKYLQKKATVGNEAKALPFLHSAIRSCQALARSRKRRPRGETAWLGFNQFAFFGDLEAF